MCTSINVVFNETIFHFVGSCIVTQYSSVVTYVISALPDVSLLQSTSDSTTCEVLSSAPNEHSTVVISSVTKRSKSGIVKKKYLGTDFVALSHTRHPLPTCF